MSAKRLIFAIPGDLATPTGGYGYDRRVIDGLRALGWQVDVVPLAASFPAPDAADLAAAEAALAAPRGTPIMVDGLAFGVFGALAERLGGRGPLIALVHHPLGFETGHDPATARALIAAEATALAEAHRVVTTSPTTARLLVEHLGVAAGRIAVAVPGVDPRAPAAGGDGTTVELISVATITARKGHDVLVAALAGLADLPWRLTIHGDKTRAPEVTARLEAQIADAGLDGRIRLAGTATAEELDRAYRQSDLFVLASHFEGYGMAYAEATAHGLPVVGTTGGAIADAVPAGAGVLVAPGDVAALRAALRRLIGDGAARAALAAGAREASRTQPRWQQTAADVARAIDLAEAQFAAGSFSVDWLSLREPFDRAARNGDVLRTVATACAATAAGRVLRVVDLGCGAGSTLRGLGPVLGGAQRWRLVDYDPVLIAAALAAAGELGIAAEPLALNLAGRIAPALEPFADGGRADLVATSAFLDLVSASWLDRLVAAIVAAGTPFYAALSYDGRATLAPALPLDAAVIAAVNRHQLTDKGFGPALGPAAATAAIERFERQGWRVDSGRSDWVFGPGDRRIQLAMIEGWARAAAEIGGIAEDALADWLTARRAAIAAGTSTMTVGHVDLFARAPRP